MASAREQSASDPRRFTARHAALSALGGIRMSGLLPEGRGLPRRPMRVLGSYAVVYLIAGEGEYRDANGVEQPVRAGDLMLLFPDLAHRYGPPAGRTWREFFLVFDGPVFDLWRAQGLLRPSEPVLHLEPIDHWLRRLESVLGGGRETGWAPPLLEVCRLQQVLGEALVGGSRGAVPQDEQRWAARACALLESDLSPSTPLASLAARMNTSYELFRKRFTAVVGMPPGRYRATRLIDRACELMQQSDMTDKQIALSLGFCDEFHFSRRFRQIAGRTPTEFRRSLPG